MNKLPAVLFMAILVWSCSNNQSYPNELDTYFDKQDGYEGLVFNVKDTLTKQEFRERELTTLRLDVQSSLISSMEMIRLENKIDSLENILNGFDKNNPQEISGHFKFKSGLDTFTYFVKLDEQMNIIQATKSR
jgi:hypothetical protein